MRSTASMDIRIVHLCHHISSRRGRDFIKRLRAAAAQELSNLSLRYPKAVSAFIITMCLFAPSGGRTHASGTA
jgi:hypothetical protein